MAEPAAPKYTLDELSQMTALDIDAMRSLYAVEMSGLAFYNAMADRLENPEAAELLRRNGREEAGHARRLGRAIAIKQGHEFEPAQHELSRSEPVALPAVITEWTLGKVLKGELAGDTTYQTWADNEPDPEIARLYRLNGREETLHSQRLQQAIDILTGS